jgi:hypothetical protein
VAAGAAPKPHEETLADLRLAVAQGKLKGAPALCDRLRAGYEQRRDQLLAQPSVADSQARAAVETYMACYCIYAKAQAQALLGDIAGAKTSLAAAMDYRASSPVFQNPRVQPLLQELTILSSGLVQERSGQLDLAIQTYLPASYLTGAQSHVVTGRLALIEFKRGHLEKAQSWAYIHADDPTSQFVLAQISVQKKNPLVAQKHTGTALGLLNQELKSGKEYLPLFFAEAPAIRALSKQLPPLPKPAAPPPTPTPPPTSPPPSPRPAAPPPMMQ